MSAEEDDDDISKFLDEDPSNDSLNDSAKVNTDDVLAEIDTLLYEDDDDSDDKTVQNDTEQNKSLPMLLSDVLESEAAPRKSEDVVDKNGDEAKKLVELPKSNATEDAPEEDYSILYDVDDETFDEEGFETVDMEDLAKTLDISILYTTADEDINETEKTVVAPANDEQPPSPRPELTDSSAKSDDKPKVPEKPAAAAAKVDNDTSFDFRGGFNEGQARLLMKKYYEKAVKSSWASTTDFANGYQIPGLNDPMLKKPLFWRDEKTGKFVVEGPDEWRDKHHPMWEEFRRHCDNDSKIGAFIHHKWNWKTSIDITRNLSRFSRRKDRKKLADGKKSNKAVKKAPDTTVVVVEDNLIEEKDIFNVLLKKFDDDNDVEASKAGAGGDAGDKSESSSDVLERAVCRYCSVICHCSPGRRQKRPYVLVSADADTVDKSVPASKHFKYEEVRNEVKDAIEDHMNRQKNPAGSSGYYTRTAANLIASTSEAFELASNYRQDHKERPYFSREQVRELLSVELAQDRYRSFYKSPYDDDAVDDDDGDELDDGHNNGELEPKSAGLQWDKSLIENY